MKETWDVSKTRKNGKNRSKHNSFIPSNLDLNKLNLFHAFSDTVNFIKDIANESAECG